MSRNLSSLEPIRRVNLASQVIDSLKSYIVKNDLRPGARLPSENELTRMFGVSRNILREALKSMETMGLIDIRVGDGTYVAVFDFSLLTKHLSFAIARNGQGLEHFAEARRVLELCALRLAAKRSDEPEMSRLEELARRIESAQTDEEAAAADLEFHKELWALAGNPVLAEFGSLVDRLLTQVPYAKKGDRRLSGTRHF